MNKCDFKTAMTIWAKCHHIPTDQCKALIDAVLGYKKSMEALLKQEGIKDEFLDTVTAFDFDKPTPSEDVKKQISDLQWALESLSKEAVNVIDVAYKQVLQNIPIEKVCDHSASGSEILEKIFDWEYRWFEIRPLLIEACKHAPDLELSYYRRGPKPKKKEELLIMNLASYFKKITGKDPASTIDGCFNEFVGYAREMLVPASNASDQEQAKIIQRALRTYRIYEELKKADTKCEKPCSSGSMFA